MTKKCISNIFAIMFALLKFSNSVEVPIYKTGDEIDFGFNDEHEVTMPDACDPSVSYCFVKGDNYPEEDIKKLLEDMRSLIVDNSENRIGDNTGDSECDTDCPTTKIFEPIYYISDENNTVRVVVQSKEKFQQIYTVRSCEKEGPIHEGTSHFSSHMLSTFKPECVTTNMDVDFFVLGDEKDITGKPKIQIARARGGIPVCCKCQLNSY